MHAGYLWLVILVLLIGSLSPKARVSAVAPYTNIQQRILDNMDFFCPKTNICNNATFDESRQELRLCCTACSCEPNCMEDRNCCFPIPMSREYQECLFARNKYSSWTEDGNQAFYMVTQCPEPSQLCGNEQVALWGSILPVYSRSTRLLYKNRVCASCHQAEDLVPWRAELLCDATFTGQNALDILNQNLLANQLPDHCHVEFYAHDEETAEAARRLQCIDKDFIVDKCPSTPFLLPKNCPFSTEEVILACESGFRSMFVHFKRHANIFCAVCSGIYIPYISLCPKEVDSRGVTFSLSMVLETDMLSRFQRTTHHGRNNPTVCLTGNSDCKAVHCPTGQLYNKKGTCEYMSSDWRMDFYEIYLQLTPLSPFTSSMLQAATEYWERRGPASEGIVSPFIKTLIVADFYVIMRRYKGKEEYTATAFMVKMTCADRIRNGAQILELIKQAIKSDKWYYRAGGVNVKLAAAFSRYISTINEYGSYKYPKYFPYVNRTNVYPIKDLPYQDGDQLSSMNTKPLAILGKPSSITEVFYCQQIELQPQEYTVFPEDIALYHIAAKRLYLDGEFSIAEYGNGIKVARVCLHNSLYSCGNHKCGAICWLIMVNTMCLLFIQYK